MVLQENSLFSSNDDFEEMVEDSGLEWAESVPSERGYYFILVQTPTIDPYAYPPNGKAT